MNDPVTASLTVISELRYVFSSKFLHLPGRANGACLCFKEKRRL
jgi:hypothetical protein